MNQAIQTVLKDPSVLNAVVFCVAATFGQLLHIVKKWTEGYAWILGNVKATIGAVIANFIGMIGFVSTGALDEITKIATVVTLGLFMGFSADSAVNKGAKKAWTDEEREAKKGG